MKIDLTKEYKNYYKAAKKPQLSDHKEGVYLTIEGRGAPAEKEFNEKVAVLYPIAYEVKKINKANNKDFTVAKLEGLW